MSCNAHWALRDRETLAAAANIFVGQTEAPLMVRPYISSMTKSELMALMVGGFATIAGGVLAAYAGMGIDAGHLVAASVISAPAALLISKLMIPETEQSMTLGHVELAVEEKHANMIDAATKGALDGMKLTLTSSQCSSLSWALSRWSMQLWV